MVPGSDLASSTSLPVDLVLQNMLDQALQTGFAEVTICYQHEVRVEVWTPIYTYRRFGNLASFSLLMTGVRGDKRL